MRFRVFAGSGSTTCVMSSGVKSSSGNWRRLLLGRIGAALDRLRHRARLRHGNEAHAWGRRGEDLAHRFLQTLGYRIIARNWRTRNGSAELDLVALDGDIIVFVEVKARAAESFVAPEEAVDELKRRHLFRAAGEFLRLIDTDPENARFDIVSILFGESESVVHYRDAIAKPLYQYEFPISVTHASQKHGETL